MADFICGPRASSHTLLVDSPRRWGTAMLRDFVKAAKPEKDELERRIEEEQAKLAAKDRKSVV